MHRRQARLLRQERGRTQQGPRGDSQSGSVSCFNVHVSCSSGRDVAIRDMHVAPCQEEVATMKMKLTLCEQTVPFGQSCNRFTLEAPTVGKITQSNKMVIHCAPPLDFPIPYVLRF